MRPLLLHVISTTHTHTHTSTPTAAVGLSSMWEQPCMRRRPKPSTFLLRPPLPGVLLPCGGCPPPIHPRTKFRKCPLPRVCGRRQNPVSQVFVVITDGPYSSTSLVGVLPPQCDRALISSRQEPQPAGSRMIMSSSHPGRKGVLATSMGTACCSCLSHAESQLQQGLLQIYSNINALVPHAVLHR
jgi:hypothetical protein